MFFKTVPTVSDLSEAIRTGRQSVSDTLAAYLSKIAAEDERHHAFKTVFEKDARESARSLDDELAAGKWRGPLHGIPIAVKDNIQIEGRIAGSGSLARKASAATADASVIARLRAAGAIIIGQTHMVEFAFGGWGTNTAAGTPRNPLDLEFHRVPGGSSSGSAVAVAAGLAPLALGTDTGGSIRIPAAMTGITGFKPSWGRVAADGLTPLCKRFDVIGPLGRNVEDCWMLFDTLISTSGNGPEALPALDRGIRIGVADPRAYGSYSARVLEAFEETCAQLSASGIKLERLTLPVDVNEVLSRTACLIGHEAVLEFGDMLESDGDRLDCGVRARLTDARRYTPADYEREWTIREEYCRRMREDMAGLDAFIFPTTPILSPRLDEIIERAMPLGDLTRLVNYLDLCAMALPTARTPEGLRHSIQVIGLNGSDTRIFAISAEIERVLAMQGGA